MTIAVKDVVIAKSLKGNDIDGSKFFSGKHEQIKNLVVDTLKAENNLTDVITKLSAGVREVIGRYCCVTVYEMQGQNQLSAAATKTLLFEVNGALRIHFTPYPE